MKAKHIFILTVTVLVVVSGMFWFAFHTFKVFNRSASEMAYNSDMSFLGAVIRETLDDYYRAHGNYPAKLTELKGTILSHCYEPGSEIPEQSKYIQMLDRFAYSTDKTYYEITWEVRDRGKLYTYKEHAVEGKISFDEAYINGQLYSRRVYTNGHVEKRYHEGKLIRMTVYENGEVVSEEKY